MIGPPSGKDGPIININGKQWKEETKYLNMNTACTANWVVSVKSQKFAIMQFLQFY